jgi:hypothetical protein
LRQLNTQALALNQGLEERLTLAIAPELLAAQWSGPLATLAAEHPLLQVEVLAAPQADALAAAQRPSPAGPGVRAPEPGRARGLSGGGQRNPGGGAGARPPRWRGAATPRPHLAPFARTC